MFITAAARRATEIAVVLQKFRKYTTDSTTDTEVAASIARLNDLSQVLRQLARLIDAGDGLVARVDTDDLELLQHNVAYTLGDIWTIFGQLSEEANLSDYQVAWRQIRLKFYPTSMHSSI